MTLFLFSIKKFSNLFKWGLTQFRPKLSETVFKKKSKIQ